jgi:hypothetical protein
MKPAANEISKQVVEVQKTMAQWWNDPLIIQLIIAAAGVVVIRLLAALLSRWAGRFVKDSQTRYRIRKVTALISYLVIILFLAVVFRNRLEGLAIGLGVAGAGIAFALQEVITSIAGWAPSALQTSLKLGIVSSWGASKATSLISASCAPPSWNWANGSNPIFIPTGLSA